jgi:hypothetical protein
MISLSTGVIIGFIVNSVITNRVIYETQERVKEALNTARWVYAKRILGGYEFEIEGDGK